MSKRFGKVVMLHGGDSPEREISFSSGKMVGVALDEICSEVVRFDPKEQDLLSLKDLNADMVFNILHGGTGEDGVVQAAMELMGIPFTGSGHLACSLAMDKDLSKVIWMHYGLTTPLWHMATDASESTLDRLHLDLGRNLFVKPNNGGSSIATRKVGGRKDLAEAITAALEYDDRVMVEQAIEGQEITYGIVGDTVLPGIRIEVEDGFYDYEAKYISDTTKLICPMELPGNLDEIAQKMSLDAFKALGCTGWGRVDLVVGGREVFLLEVNTIPGMTDHSLVPRAAREYGWDMAQLVTKIMEASR